MSVGIAINGRDVDFNMGGGAILGVTSKGISFTNEMGDTSDDDSGGWTEFLATPLKKSAELTISGTVKNLELMAAYFNVSQIFAIVKTYPDGSTLTFDAAMTGAPSFDEPTDQLSTYEFSLTSSGAVVFAAGA